MISKLISQKSSKDVTVSFQEHKKKAHYIQEKLKQVQKELSEKEFEITNTFEKLLGKQNNTSGKE